MPTTARPTDHETRRDMSGLLLFVAIIAALLLPHILSYLSTRPKPKMSPDSLPRRSVESVAGDPSLGVAESTAKTSTLPMDASATKIGDEKDRKNDQAQDTVSSSNWRCACEGGFLPPGMLQSLGGAEAVIRMSTGQCYHK
jgi:hypothetical protein